MKKIKAIIWDLDGTLVDSFPGIHESLNDVLRSFHLAEVDLDTVKRRVGRGVENLLRESVPEELIETGVSLFRASYEATHLNKTFLFPGVRDVLLNLQSSGIVMVVASNKPENFSRNILKHLQLEEFIEDCFGPDKEIKPKPHPSMLQAAMSRLGVRPEETLYVGDMLLDVETARNAGVRVALVATGAFTKGDLQTAQPSYLLDTLNDLLPLVS